MVTGEERVWPLDKNILGINSLWSGWLWPALTGCAAVVGMCGRDNGSRMEDREKCNEVKLARKKEVMEESWGEKQRRSDWENQKGRQEEGELFLCRYPDREHQKNIQNTLMVEKKYFPASCNLSLWLQTTMASARFTFMPCEVKKKKKKQWNITPLHAPPSVLIRTIYFCLRYGPVEIEVGVWRQIASIYSSKLKSLISSSQSVFPFPLYVKEFPEKFCWKVGEVKLWTVRRISNGDVSDGEVVALSWSHAAGRERLPRQ